MSQEWVNESDGSEVIPNSSQDSDSTIPYHTQSNSVLSQGKLIVNTNTTHLYFSFILLLNVNNQNEHLSLFLHVKVHSVTILKMPNLNLQWVNLM